MNSRKRLLAEKVEFGHGSGSVFIMVMVFFFFPLDHGKESSVQLNNMNGDGVLQAMEKLVTSAAP